MNSSSEILSVIEGNSTDQEDTKSIQERLNIKYERNARIMMHVLENDPNKYQESLNRELSKLEKKIDKEYKKLRKKTDSYNSSFSLNSEKKIRELQNELIELEAFV